MAGKVRISLLSTLLITLLGFSVIALMAYTSFSQQTGKDQGSAGAHDPNGQHSDHADAGSHARRVSLRDAIATELARVSITSNGGSSGDSIKVTIERGPKAGIHSLEIMSVEITVPPGTILINRNGNRSNMVVGEIRGKQQVRRHEEPVHQKEIQSSGVGEIRGREGMGANYTPTSQIVLPEWHPDTATYVLSAFSVNFEKENPSENDSFSVDQPDMTLACIMTNSANMGIQGRQAAVWIYKDHTIYSNMYRKFAISTADFDKAQGVVDNCLSK